ncbi:poly-gamma-glutamate synthase PgsB [Candidatus Bipolaricaulota bacterium]
MPASTWALVPVGLVIAGKLLEGFSLRKMRARVPIVVHVNGTRGKTQTTKLITHVLQANGIRTLGKTTGDRPQLIEPDGTSTPIRRRAPASIAEQAWTVRQAARRNAEALVVECMAIHPEFQKASERAILRSQIGVITNVRLDHIDVQGDSLEDISRALSSAIPYQGIVFTAESENVLQIERESAKRKTELVVVEPAFPEELNIGELYPDNVALVLAVCQHLGVDFSTAAGAIEQYARHETSDRSFSIRAKGKLTTFINALPANDPISTQLRLENEMGTLGCDVPWVGLFCHRRDRAFRARLFQPLVEGGVFDTLFTAGDRMTGRQRIFPEAIDLSRLGQPARLWQQIVEHLDDESVVFAFGNAGGIGQQLAEYLEEIGEPT